MYLAQNFAKEIEQFKNQMLQAYNSKLALHLDLPPLNIRVANMNAQQRTSFYYWLARAHNEFIYIQLTNRQGQTFHAGYLKGDERLDDFYISKIESSSGKLKTSERLQIQDWIRVQHQFNGVLPKNLDHSIQISSQPIRLKQTWGRWIFIWTIALILAELVLWGLGLVVMLFCSGLTIIKYQHLNKYKKEIKKQDWSKSILSQLSQNIQQCKQQQFKDFYQLSDATVSQYDDHNMVQNSLPHNLTPLVARIESFSSRHNHDMRS